MSAIILYITDTSDDKLEIWFDPGSEETDALERFMSDAGITDWVHDETTMKTTLTTPGGVVLIVEYAYMDEPGMILG